MSRPWITIVAVLGVGGIVAGSYLLVDTVTESRALRQSTAVVAPTATGSAPPGPTPTVRAGDPGDRAASELVRRLGPERGGPFGARITSGSAQVALTFDDGPDPRYTPQVLALLRRQQVRATFCVVGVNVRAHPELVRAIADDGHTLCNHSWSHDVRLGRRSPAAIMADLTRTNRAIQAAVPGAEIGYFRQPGGAWTRAVVTVAGRLGMTSLHWAVDPRDWTRPASGTISRVVTSGVRPGSIVLLHDAGGDRRETVKALHPMVTSLRQRFSLSALPTGNGPAVAP
ncbi:polysaccharide deacetylase family protein [Plantactinospora sp. WMMB782]|uniref:polysaccharide deacetylase family protein n=1 Tax=Plantactinospora sp. WMMB782 TaxID=3404121 RepID=UPI003B9356A0